MELKPEKLTAATMILAIEAGQVANYCDHIEHNENADRGAVLHAGQRLRELALELTQSMGVDPIESFASRLEAIEARNVLSSADSFDGAAAARAAGTWRALQLVQIAHDRAYHADVIGMSKVDQLRHYALHLAKLAGATAMVADGKGEFSDWAVRRLPDILLFGVKLSTVAGEKLTGDPVGQESPPRERTSHGELPLVQH